VDGRLGRLETGYEFDAILLDDDPSDMQTFTGRASVTGVFQQGVAVVPHPRLEPSSGP
jgi:imidazolonepropionase-like amidohydrolase